jgi:hypothetical protein
MHKKEEAMSFARKWIELELIRLSEISPVQKDEYHIFLSYAHLREKRYEDKKKTIRNIE